MKRIISGAILLLCFIGFEISAWAAGIVNPSFVFSKNGLAGWTSGAALKEKYIAGVLDESCDDVGMCATLKNLEANYSYLVQRITGLKPGDCYLITVMAKVKSGVSGSGAGINARGVNADGEYDAENSSERLTQPGEWRQLSLYVLLDKGASQFDLYLELGSAENYSEGYAYFDCVEITKLEELPEGAEAVLIKGEGLSADAYILIGVILCLVLAGFIAFRKGRVRRNGLQKDAQTQAEDNQADEL